ncbi:retrovirus-related pol polyprotein from transposon TNT 1-94 [Tanacetum coccineum]|uniref:Retrovirus-related pol polyprotein from transposon TNT 1-94 n=1 Tax=Tanacetum coccineum TaxID=301880 RepID=A0ABQ5H2B3_9ASTR
MEDEMNSLHENNTFELARLVVKGFSQKRGIDFDEIFSPVVKMRSIRVVLGLAASLDLEVEQMDVKTAFLHGDLDKEIYMEQPEARFVQVLFYERLGAAKQYHWHSDFRDRGAMKLHIITREILRRRILKRWIEFHMPSEVGSLNVCLGVPRRILLHVAGGVRRFLSNPVRSIGKLVNGLFRYLRGTSILGITLKWETHACWFHRLDYGGNKDNMKLLLIFDGPLKMGQVQWQSRLLSIGIVYNRGRYCSNRSVQRKLLWLKRFCKNLVSSNTLAKMPLKYGMFELNKVHTDDNASDMLTLSICAVSKRKFGGIFVFCCSFTGDGELILIGRKRVLSREDLVYLSSLIVNLSGTRAECVRIIKARNLAKALGNKTSLVTFNGTIGKKFGSIEPFRANNIVINGTRDKGPRFGINLARVIMGCVGARGGGGGVGCVLMCGGGGGNGVMGSIGAESDVSLGKSMQSLHGADVSVGLIVDGFGE